MADARLRGEWLGSLRHDNLSDTAWRVFTGALMWSNENGTDGLIPKRYLKYLHPEGEQSDAINAIEAAGMWVRQGNDYQLLDWDGELGQSTALEVQTYKANGRKRSKAYRERVRAKLANQVGFEAPKSGSTTRDATRDVRANVGKGKGTGKGTDSSAEEDHRFAAKASAEVPDAEVVLEHSDVAGASSSIEIAPASQDYCRVCGRSLEGWPMASRFAICKVQDKKHEEARRLAQAA
jgi:hypothetical protein